MPRQRTALCTDFMGGLCCTSRGGITGSRVGMQGTWQDAVLAVPAEGVVRELGDVRLSCRDADGCVLRQRIGGVNGGVAARCVCSKQGHL